MTPIPIEQIAYVLDIETYLKGMALTVLLMEVEVLVDTHVELVCPGSDQTVALCILTLAAAEILAVVDEVPEVLGLICGIIYMIPSVWFIVGKGK